MSMDLAANTQVTRKASGSQVVIRLVHPAFFYLGVCGNTASAGQILCVNRLREGRYKRDQSLRHNLTSRPDGQTPPSMQATT